MTRQDKTRQEPCCINLYLSSGKERPLQDRIYKIDTVTPAITISFRPLYLIKGEEVEIDTIGLLDMPGQEQSRRGYKPDGLAPTLSTMQGGNRQPKIMIKENNSRGFSECSIPGVADLSFSGSSAPTGRTQDGGNTSPTIDTAATGLTVFETEYRIRRLTPLEYWRLMGFSDIDFRKAEKVCSNTQLYKQAGNSIVVDVLEAIFKNLIE